MRFAALCLMLLAFPAAAQDKAQTLADIKAELGQLMAEVNSLMAELVSSGAASTGIAGGDALQRMDAIEAELMRLTSKAEEIELKLNRVVADGTNRLGDLEFRLCEATEGCDINSLPDTAPLGGDVAAAPAAPAAQPAAPAAGSSSGPELAMGEQADFDRAKEVLGQGDFRTAADLFATFAQAYPGGPLTQEAQYQRGEALNQLGDTAEAARAYLDAFSGKPDGSFAADSLLRLGQALGTLGQVPDACLTLAEVGNRFPGSIQATNAQVSMQGLACP
ncbi:MAG: tol-pal system protein YbgF [Rhodobacteraceae bacterium]|nr:tol-pal system protein YbgF [Paracoccaceae bacterium]